MSVIAVCNTPLQIIFAINLRYTVYKDEVFDIIISDHMKDSDKLVYNSNKYGVFSEAYYVKSKEYCSNYKCLVRIIDKIKNIRQEDIEFKQLISNDKKYDIFLFNNSDNFNKLAYNQFCKRNRKMKAYLIEDGFSSYYAQGCEWEYLFKTDQKFISTIKEIVFGYRYLSRHINGQLVYNKDLVDWEAPFERIQVPALDIKNTALIDKINKLFGYDKMVDKYDEPAIFFEESFRVSGHDIGDIALLEKISKVLGKENIIVKRHPRSDAAIFNEMGYKTNSNVEIPWELMVINNPDMLNKLFITVCSGAAATPFTMFGLPVKSLILLDLVKDRTLGLGVFYDLYFKYMRENVFKKNPDIFFMPENESELMDFLDTWKVDNIEG